LLVITVPANAGAATVVDGTTASDRDRIVTTGFSRFRPARPEVLR
jgi:hypothetical protein